MNIRRGFYVFFTVMSLVYIAISFSILNFNPITWSMDLRVLLSITFVLSVLGGVGASNVEEEEKINKSESLEIFKYLFSKTASEELETPLGHKTAWDLHNEKFDAYISERELAKHEVEQI